MTTINEAYINALLADATYALDDTVTKKKGTHLFLGIKGANHATEGEGFGAKLSTSCGAAWA
ncbi:MAG: hypothetical protein R3E62_05555 [Pseudomonadales bacterium]